MEPTSLSTPNLDPDGRFEQDILIAAPPSVVFDCFFSPESLATWWHAVRSVTTAVALGVYAIEWPQAPEPDDVLGPLGGVFHGTVVEVRSGHQFLVANAYWVPPTGDPIGPMVFEVTCRPDPEGCRLHVRQDGYDPSPRWQRYYSIVSHGWQNALAALREHAEQVGS